MFIDRTSRNPKDKQQQNQKNREKITWHYFCRSHFFVFQYILKINIRNIVITIECHVLKENKLNLYNDIDLHCIF